MRETTARAIVYATLATLVGGVVYATPQLPQTRPVADVLVAQNAVPRVVIQRTTDTLGRGESLRSVFARGGVSQLLADGAIRTLTVINPGRVRAGMPVTFHTPEADSVPNEIVLQLAVDRFLHLHRDGDVWTEREETLPWTTDTVVVAGKIASTLYAAMDEAATQLPASAREQLTWALADVYEYKIDMSRDLQVGDAFRVMAERSTAPNGAVRMGPIVAATFTLSGTELQAVHYTSSAIRDDYFDAEGRSLRAAFLRAPLQFRRISSTFGGRFHPVLKVWRAHRGTDYAAAMGTPVRAVGDGVVIRANWSNGYGNVLEIRHRNGYVTRYGHLRGYASGVRAGTRVTIGQTVAYVGTTGMSTGPHLHFEVLVNGAQRDPRTALRNKGGDPVPAKERAAFEQQRTVALAALAGATPTLGLAAR